MSTAAKDKQAPAKEAQGPPGKAGPPGAGGEAGPSVGYFDLFKFSTPKERAILYFGLLGEFIGGMSQPCFGIVLGQIVLMFNPALTVEQSEKILYEIIWILAAISAGQMFSNWVGHYLMQRSAENLTFTLRTRYLDALMRQEIKFFEKQSIEELPGKLQASFRAIHEGSGEKVGQLCQAMGAVTGGILIGYIVNPTYSIPVSLYIPIFAYVLKKLTNRIIMVTIKKMGAIGRLGGFIEETLAAVKLIVSFGQEELRLEEFSKIATEVCNVSKSSSGIAGGIGGVFFFIVMGQSLVSWVVAGYFFKYEIVNWRTGEPIQLYEVYTCYQALLYGLMQSLQITGLFPQVARMAIAGKDIVNTIDRAPEIKNRDDGKAVKDFEFADGIHFKDVKFRYPTALESVPDVFTKASFKIRQGTSTAIVGPSGSGKSTIVQLINRFYDPEQGSISYGKTDIKDIDLVSLRQKIGYVGQEPVLIVGTIRENLSYGNAEATEAEMREALSLASAEFVFRLKDQLDTYVGSSTVLNLSGGQKQRIAIARALLKKPSILVLDEATSALDPKSEAEVQAAIMRIQKE